MSLRRRLIKACFHGGSCLNFASFSGTFAHSSTSLKTGARKVSPSCLRSLLDRGSSLSPLTISGLFLACAGSTEPLGGLLGAVLTGANLLVCFGEGGFCDGSGRGGFLAEEDAVAGSCLGSPCDGSAGAFRASCLAGGCLPVTSSRGGCLGGGCGLEAWLEVLGFGRDGGSLVFVEEEGRDRGGADERCSKRLLTADTLDSGFGGATRNDLPLDVARGFVSVGAAAFGGGSPVRSAGAWMVVGACFRADWERGGLAGGWEREGLSVDAGSVITGRVLDCSVVGEFTRTTVAGSLPELVLRGLG